MLFCEQLNAFMEEIACTANELCEKAELSAASVSRYRSGERIPEQGGQTFVRLCGALEACAAQRGLRGYSAKEIAAAFCACENYSDINCEQLRLSLCALLDGLCISSTQLCKAINYEPSTLSRIRSGARQPADPAGFAFSVADFLTKECKEGEQLRRLCSVLQKDEAALSPERERRAAVLAFLCSDEIREAELQHFLEKLSEFDLNEYIKVIHFDTMKVPSFPLHFPSAKYYTTLRGMMDSELAFLKQTVLSSSTQDVIMYSDMPIETISRDPEFPKKWMLGMAMMLKKGLRLHMIHSLDRPMREMMLGLESYIPMYMTGQITPYYLQGKQNAVFLHFLKVSGAAALSGEAISGSYENGRYYLSSKSEDLAYFQRRAKDLLHAAKPLMEIYRAQHAPALFSRLEADASRTGRRRMLCASLPLFTMPPQLLCAVLDRYAVPNAEKEKILASADAQLARAEQILAHSALCLEIPAFSEAAFGAQPPLLNLCGAFYEQDLSYTREEYAGHLEATKAFAAAHPRCTLRRLQTPAFSNLQILIFEGQWAMVSKNRSPAVHFMIRHPALCRAIEHFSPPLVEC